MNNKQLILDDPNGPAIRGISVSVNAVLSMLGKGATYDQVLKAHTGLKRADIAAAIEWARVQSSKLPAPRDRSDSARQAWETRRLTRAISIRQPYAELILRGCKTREFRSVRTDIRERVYIYAGLKPGDPEWFETMGLDAGDLPAGVLVGTVEIADCVPTRQGDGFAYVLENPRRLNKPLKPVNQPQPIWFRPF